MGLGLSLALGALAVATPALAGEASDRGKARALLLLRILAYDHNLKKRAGERVTVLVVHNPRDEASLRMCADLVEAFGRIEKIKIAGMPFAVAESPFAGVSILEASARKAQPAALFVCPGLAGDAGAIAEVTRRLGVLSFTTTEDELRAGLSVAVVDGDDRLRLVVNVAASRAEGARLDAGLLQLCRLVEGAAP